MDNMFLKACADNKKGIVQAFLKKGSINVDKRDPAGRTPLSHACQKGARDIVQLLLQHGADVSMADNSSNAPIHYAAQTGNKNIVELLLAKDVDVNASNQSGTTPLLIAVQNGRTELALFLLGKGADKDIKDNVGRNAMDYASAAGLRDFIKAADEGGAATGKDDAGNTRLHQAVHNGQSEVVKALLAGDAGKASVNEPNDQGKTPLLIAVDISSVPIVEMLLNAGADPLAAGLEGQTALHYATLNGSKPMVSSMLNLGADINGRDTYGRTPLMIAAMANHNDLAVFLIEQNADVNAADNYDKTAMAYANDNGSTEIVETLLMAGAEN